VKDGTASLEFVGTAALIVFSATTDIINISTRHNNSSAGFLTSLNCKIDDSISPEPYSTELVHGQLDFRIALEPSRSHEASSSHCPDSTTRIRSHREGYFEVASAAGGVHSYIFWNGINLHG
jgi:hypothetical protein